MDVPVYLPRTPRLPQGRQAPGVDRQARQATQGSAGCQHWAALKAGGARPFCASFLPVSPIKLMSTSTPELWARIAGPRERPSCPAHFFVPTVPKTHTASGGLIAVMTD